MMKAWWKSRVLWFNAIVSGLVALEATFSALQSLLPGNIYAISVTVLAVGNAMLRIVTTQGIGK